MSEPENRAGPYEITRLIAAALLVLPDGRYVMQRRDDIPTIMLPGHWALFGGGIEPGETVDAAIRRELMEELGFAAREVRPFCEMVLEVPLLPPRFDRLHFLVVPILDRDLDGLVVYEGAGFGVFTADALARETKVSPWDLAAVLMHARGDALFGDKPHFGAG